jgi:glycosyltransferase involved in cell wall biosynthesis
LITLINKIYYSAVVPCHNESGNLEKLVSRLSEVLKKEAKPFEIIIVNDNSRDDSKQVLDRLKKKFKELRYINRTTDPGVGNAKRAGFAAAQGEFIITMDGDLSHDPYELPKFLRLKDKYDIICGSRYISHGRAHMNWSRKLISGMFNLTFRTLIGIKVRDFTSGYRLIRRNVFDKVKLESHGFGIYIEIPLKAHIYGFRLTEVPITYHKREYGTSNLSYLKQGPEYVKVGLKTFGLRLARIFGIQN